MFHSIKFRVLQISLGSNTRKLVKAPPILQVSSGGLELEMVSWYSKYTWDASLKVSSRSNIRKLVKTPPILQVTSWSLGGKGCSWWSWRWCHGTQNIPGKLDWKFHQDLSSGSLSRLHLSSKSLPGVLEDMEVPDGPGDGLGGPSIPKGTYPEDLMMIKALELWFCKDVNVNNHQLK